MGLYKIFQFITNHPISGKSKFTSLFRFVWWQLRCLVTSDDYHHLFTEHSKLIISKGMTGATGNLYCGLHEYKEMLFLLHYLRRDELFVDVGANIGSYTVLASAEIGAHTYCIEPVPNTFNQLHKNISLNNISKNTVLMNIGLSSQKGELLFSDEQDSSMNHVVNSSEANSTTKKIEVNTLDAILNNENPSLLKIDVEGFELEVLNGGEETLKKNSLKAIIIELNGSGMNYGFKDTDIDEKLKSYGFQSFEYDPFRRVLIPAKLHDFDNLIYVRDLEYVKKIIIDSPKFRILNLEI